MNKEKLHIAADYADIISAIVGIISLLVVIF